MSRILPTEKNRLSKMRFTFVAYFLLVGSTFSQEFPGSVVTNSLKMTLVKVEKGNFLMGGDSEQEWTDEDELPAFSYQISSPYWIQSTRAMFDEFCSRTGFVTDLERIQNRSGLGTVGTWRDERLDQDPDLPVVMVSYDDAVAFCLWLSGHERERYRLPTEPEWEYACRAGSSTVFSGTSSLLEACRDNCIGISDLASIRELNPVTRSKLWKCGSGKKNDFGLFDMSGNASEIVDGYHLNYSKGIVRPSSILLPPPTGISTRGGSCNSGPEHARCSSRMWIKRGVGNEWTGFRVVLEK